jgi:hypothetical protein
VTALKFYFNKPVVMKRQNFKIQTIPFYLILIGLLFTGINCKKENLKINPKKAILEKWKLRKRGVSLDHLVLFTPTGYN